MKQHFQNLVDEEEAAIDMTPMLDVVFIMLIFFIVTASFVKEAGIDVNRPEAATAVKKDRANILIAISDKGEIWINKRRIDVRAVQANIERLRAENPQGSVVIQADKKATTETLIKVMDASRAAGVYDVSIAAQEQ
ncbi:biopolymer transporter ExbD [Alteromonas sp. DY56-G5]|jgi:biopolymer transport protein ExbD|uniref:Biopolymer transport ExbD/TolR family protein n=4 Tax=root TaxID=1 RepID=A0A126PWA8_ALTMA|nr:MULTISPECIES: biopolymer transporter ExbD [Alteromonas]AFT77240.1 biopolymer transport protein [Alteromonas macleodii str. 'Black Sea 11']MCG8498685.1 biopolymer transporter ExbD [Enterobacterales bacterium]MEC7081304.1 biopolymer transporter ExbD [Pseudomonadota bacterium]NKX18934.1 biopolymer transporter ExbD [Alteromonadaceae bacterium A_SAG5]NKX21479.1 biopolymer transporter ExbD [Alteromonadaceae bacterium A_SAG2]NKX31982.1 biopolymer transporter ExbD [Alteromonadaceae bacterium A_SAG|tara:strand:+ start:459 stop:866 length:408 start_codon:yes stop_codon:yes gene_type:complete